MAGKKTGDGARVRRAGPILAELSRPDKAARGLRGGARFGKVSAMFSPFKRFLSGHGGALAALAAVSAVEAQLYLGFGMRRGASPPPALFETLLSPIATVAGTMLSVCRFLDMFFAALLVNGIVFHLCAKVGRARLARRAELDRYAGMRVDPEEIRRRVAEYRLRHMAPGAAPNPSRQNASGAAPEPSSRDATDGARD